MALTKINIKELSFNPFDCIGVQWMLISAGTEEKWNTMTASWGGVGIMWGKPSATCYIRQSRYTKEFVDQSEYFTLTFLKDGYRDVLNRMGSNSGRDIDKMHDSGLTSVFMDGQPTFAEASLVLVCKKQGQSDITLDQMSPDVVNKWYADKDYHTMYIGEIIAAYQG